jgi:hypothetical protein
LKKNQNMGRLQLTGMPADVLALVLAACTVPALHRAAATNKLIHEAGAERRRKIAVLKQSPFSMTCADVVVVNLNIQQLSDDEMVKFSEALSSGAMAQLQARSLPTALSASPESWHAHSPDPDVLFRVQYAGAFARRK